MNSFVYLHANDLDAARQFYAELLELDEIFDDGDVVGFRIGSLQLTIARHEEVERAQGWARQLGWEGGTTRVPSWGFDVGDEAFRGTVDRLRAASVDSWTVDPVWVGYWSFPVIDPMGYTVEVSATGKGAW